MGYSDLKLPTDLMDEVNRYVGKYGYRSKAEFVKDAIRRLLEVLSKKEELTQ